LSKLSQSKILVTGVQGQVGFEIIRGLTSTGAELFASTRSGDGFRLPQAKAVALDLSDKMQINAVIKEIQPDIVINAAAYTAVDKAESERDLAFRVNCEAVGLLADALKEHGGSMIHFSTDYIYNPTHDRPIGEDEKVNPVNAYAQSKRAGEDLLLSSGIPAIVLRTSWVYGLNGNNFVKTMLRLGLEKEILRVVGDQWGAPTSANTLAQAVSMILIQGMRDPRSFIERHAGIYNISDHGVVTWHGFAEEIFRLARIFGLELKVREVVQIRSSEYPTPAQRPFNSRMNLAKIRSMLGIFPPAWQQSLYSYLELAYRRLP
jgi:dTDP-4-dehydrorhamnose reductase